MKYLLSFIFISLTLSVTAQKTKSDDLNERVGVDKIQFKRMDLNPNFCENLLKIIESGRDQFTSIKGEKTSRQISGVERPFFFSNIELDKNHRGYVGDNDQYPEYEIVLSDNRFQTPEMKADFDTLSALVKKCFDNSNWVIQFKDATNDIYLEGTDFKKIQVRENKTGIKTKFEINLYNNRVRGHWVVELHIDGIGKLPEKKATEGKN